MSTLGFVVPGGPVPRTGGTLYNRRIAAAMERQGIQLEVISLQATWPLPRPTERPHLLRQLASIPSGLPLLVDGLLWTGLAELGLQRHHPCAVLVHSPLFRETGLRPSVSRTLLEQERAALRHATICIATGPPTIRDLNEHLGQDAVQIPPGTSPAVPSPARSPRRWLCVATLPPRQGHDRLLRALAALPHRDFTLRCAGSSTLAPSWSAQLHELRDDLGLTPQIQFLGELDRTALDREFQSCGAVLHTAHYEAWGMALTEAVARGLPVLSTPAGALEGPAGAAAMVLPADFSSTDFRATLERFVAQHAALVRTARSLRLPTWDDRARQLWDVLAPTVSR
jgi:glycosyltransferase involved in cell wall biosynthesis